ncbi:beta,beta-carotene 15,15'-dioxygenase-like [Argopecten irradians]|uniref:beta,beta-carotene 15,15'-dioxygenase-like n=1 Tax=Argopecten irradians TaxID=31199 RepID=UPI003714EC21
MYRLFENAAEIEEPMPGQVKGCLPEWLSGSLYRNGPGMYEVGESKMLHWFDGMACLQRFEIRDGNATYMRKYIQSETYHQNLSMNRIVNTEFGTYAEYPDPCKKIYEKINTYYIPKTDNTSVTVWPLGNRMFVSSETSVSNEVDPDTLETTGKLDISKTLKLDAAAAHAHWETDGTVHFIGYTYTSHPCYCLYKIPGRPGGAMDIGDARVTSSIKCKWPLFPSYYHSFAMTEDYYVFIEQPYVLNLTKVVNMVKTKNAIIDCMDFRPMNKTVFHIVDRHTGREVNTDFAYHTDPMFFFHHANMYQEGGNLVVDLCAFRDARIMKLLYIKDLLKESFQDTKSCEEVKTCRLRRYVLPLNVSESTPLNEDLVNITGCRATAVRRNEKNIFLTSEQMFNEGFEFPQINYGKLNGKKYRYLYGYSVFKSGQQALVKIDMQTKETKSWFDGTSHPSEPIFVPRPESTEEDDGVILSAINSNVEGKYAYLLVLDAKTFTECARVEFPDIRFLRDLHGLFRPH